MKRFLALVGIGLFLYGCTTISPVISPPPIPERVPEHGNYEIIPGREPTVVAALRAAPPPAQPELIQGTTLISDQNALSAQSFALIGTAHFRSNQPSAEQQALEKGKEVGADKILVYPHFSPEKDQPDNGNLQRFENKEEFLAAYYVRFKLLFGATFRNLTASEQQTLDTTGGVRIGKVMPGTPASTANLLTGDIVLKLKGRSIENKNEFQNLLKTYAGLSVKITILRNKEILERVIKLGAFLPY